MAGKKLYRFERAMIPLRVPVTVKKMAEAGARRQGRSLNRYLEELIREDNNVYTSKK